ncbi:MAG: hypothetical protein R3349_07540, partial [Geminicoccaceae bacterium]|nr:hypothetical protein [Geminicoccaceae bacterium]
LLTLVADTEKREEDEWLAEIEPDRTYQIYGDRSLQSDGVPASGKLYLRLEKDGDFVQIADFSPGVDPRRNTLSAYRRTLYGFQQSFTGDRVALETFGTREDSFRRLDEFRLRGTSGPFDLSSDDIVRNSETVEVVTRSFAPDGPVVDSDVLVRGIDYELEYDIGRIILNAPLSGVDRAFRPRFLRVIYEVEERAADDVWIYGSNARLALSERLSLGMTFSREDGEATGRDVAGSNVLYAFDDDSWIAAEISHAERQSLQGDTEAGSAGRLAFERETETYQLDGQVVIADQGFDNLGSGVRGGTATAEGTLTYRIDENHDLVERVEVFRERQRDQDSASAETLLTRRLSERLTVGGGHRFAWSRQENDGATTSVTSNAVVGVAEYQPELVPGLALSLRGEQALAEGDRWRIGSGADYTLGGSGALSATYEVLSGFDARGRPDDDGLRHRWVAGIVQPLSEHVDVYSEFRDELEVDAGQAAALGFRSRYGWDNGVRFRLNGERTLDLGEGDDDGYGASLRLLSPNSEALEWSLRLEYADDDGGSDWLADVATGVRLSRTLRMLLRNRVLFGDGRPGVDERLKVGLAYRNPSQSDFAGLLGYEFRVEPIGAGGRDSRHILRADGNLELTRDARVWSQVATRTTDVETLELAAASTAWLTRARLTFDLDPVWSVSGMASVFGAAQEAGLSLGAGLELARRIAQGQVAVGYNHFEYAEPDLDEDSIYNRGVYVRYSLIIDESTLAGLLEAFE